MRPSPNFKKNRQTRAIADQTKILEEEITTPAIKSPTLESVDDEENVKTKAIDSEISDMISSLLNHSNTHKEMNFMKEDFNNYKINDKPYEPYDDISKYDDTTVRISHNFLKRFIEGNILI